MVLEKNGFTPKQINVPETVLCMAQEGQPGRGPLSAVSDGICAAKTCLTTCLSILGPNASLICRAIRGQPKLGLRRFISTMAAMNFLEGPFGPYAPT